MLPLAGSGVAKEVFKRVEPKVRVYLLWLYNSIPEYSDLRQHGGFYGVCHCTESRIPPYNVSSLHPFVVWLEGVGSVEWFDDSCVYDGTSMRCHLT
jgi:hypothetical protein